MDRNRFGSKAKAVRRVAYRTEMRPQNAQSNAPLPFLRVRKTTVSPGAGAKAIPADCTPRSRSDRAGSSTRRKRRRHEPSGISASMMNSTPLLRFFGSV